MKKKLLFNLLIVFLVLIIPLQFSYALANNINEFDCSNHHCNCIHCHNNESNYAVLNNPQNLIFSNTQSNVLNKTHVYNYTYENNDTVIDYNYFQSLTKNRFGNNVSGTCISLSAAMLLGYYDDKYYDGVLYSPYEGEGNIGTSEQLHQYIINDIQPNTQNGEPDQVYPTIGVMNYLNNYHRNICFNNLSINTAYNNNNECKTLAKNCIDNNVPILLWFIANDMNARYHTEIYKLAKKQENSQCNGSCKRLKRGNDQASLLSRKAG